MVRRSGSKEGIARDLNANQRRIKEQMQEIRSEMRDISPLPVYDIDWERRKACMYDLATFDKEYLPTMFSRPWSQSQLRANQRLQETSLQAGMFAVAMPRSEGKTTLAIGSCIWDQAYGHRRYIYYIGSDQEQADDRLQIVKDEWFHNKKLMQDFPEIAYPVKRIEGRNELTKGQLYGKVPTHISWAINEIHFASLKIDAEMASLYIENDCLDALIPLDEEGEWWTFKNNGNIMKSKGIGGNIRGALFRHPLTGELLRPDKFILDDVQDDKTAENPNSVRKMVTHIDGAIKGLADPIRGISGVNLCTVRADGDVSENYLDPIKRAQWHPQRCSIVNHWPDGITNTEITDATESSRHWQIYAELRQTGFRDDGNSNVADQYYATHRDVMDLGFDVDNPYRFTEPEGEISAQQHAMNLRLYNLVTFMAEYMNRPIRELASGTIVINTDTIISSMTNIPRYHVPQDNTELCAWIDVGDELLWYVVGSASRSYNIHIPEYGTWPKFESYITKGKARVAKFLTREYLRANPTEKSGSGAAAKAPPEAKIYWCLLQLIGQLKKMVIHSQSGAELRVAKIGIDAGWGKMTKTIYRLIYDLRDPNIFPTFGKFIGASSMQLCDYGVRAGQFIGEHLIIKPPAERDVSVKGTVYPISHLLIDANYWKSFIWQRFATPLGTPSGTITLFDGNHEMLADHVVKSEYPLPVTARSITVDEWQSIPGQDNDLFDGLYNVAAIMSLMGCSLSNVAEMKQTMKAMQAAGKASVDLRSAAAQVASQPKKRVKLSEMKRVVRQRRSNR